tara:strand:+ start:523 stop:843 length:321 start_codon:yes stop_codon:yes gene_type:complete
MQAIFHFKDPSKSDDLAVLCAFLRARKGWHKAATIKTSLGFTDRQTRALASNSEGVVVSAPGSPGYKHIAHCTGPEIERIAAKIAAQADKMGARRADIVRAYHSQA